MAPLSQVQELKKDEWLFQEGGAADHFYLLEKGSVKLVFAGIPQGSTPAPSVELRTITEPGRAIGWSALVRPHRYHAGAVAQEDTRVLKFEREDLIRLCSDDPEFGIKMMQRILWVLGNRLRSSRIRLVVQKYHQEILAIRSLLDQSAETLEVTSPLHKIPYYLENRLTIADAFDVLNLVQAHG
ncbi:MAG: cyclic nucleotide-binding domain-containing protein, partial [bacterium]|nr:cyclic nucleotide-binding domain-containing protein [bacterium]